MVYLVVHKTKARLLTAGLFLKYHSRLKIIIASYKHCKRVSHLSCQVIRTADQEFSYKCSSYLFC